MTLVNVYKDRLFQKKVAKVTKLAGAGKKYKKYLIKKKFEEDDTPNGKMKKEKRTHSRKRMMPLMKKMAKKRTRKRLKERKG